MSASRVDTNMLEAADDTASTARDRLAASARLLAVRAEQHVLEAKAVRLAAEVTGVSRPSDPMSGLPEVEYRPSAQEEPQPSVECVVRGGSTPKLGRALLDTGAAFTLVSRAVADEYGLEVRPYAATFSVANGTRVTIVGTVDFSLQVHDDL